VEPQGIACPSCNTMNEEGWSFCQQCGGRLPQSASPAPEWKPQADYKTTASPAVDFAAPATVVAEPPISPVQPTDSGAAPTVVVETPTQPGARPSAERLQPPITASPPAPPPPPPVRATGQPEPPKVAPPPPPPPAAKPPIQAAPPAQTPMTEVVQSSPNTIVCPQCGHPGTVGSAFCATCGAAMTVPKTIVMSSPYAPLKGKLHLVMEGGQLGEVYEVNDETVIGRTNGDICFPHDGFMSGKHAKIVRRGGAFVLTDEGSRNGTFVKIKGDVELKSGDMILVGKQLFRFET
jgi:hypothetical protein